MPVLNFSSARAAVPANTPYRTAAAILALTPEQAQRQNPATIQGVVTLASKLGLIVQDHTAGIWIPWRRPEDFTTGDLVIVEGVTESGHFSPVVRPITIRSIGHAPLPRPAQVTYRELSTGDEDAQYVSVSGVVRSMWIQPGAEPSHNVWIKLALPDGFINAAFPARDATALGQLIDATVRISAAALCTKNQNGQITAPTLAVESIKYLTVLHPPPLDLFAQPLTPIGALMQYRSGTDYFHRVRVTGKVTYYKSGDRVILEGNGRALLVMTTQTSDIHLGDIVEALGFPTPEDSGPILEDAVLRLVSHGQPLQPAAVSMSEITSGAARYNLVKSEGRLLRRVDEPSREVLLLQDQSTLMLAELARPVDPGVLRRLQEGSTIRVSGISMVEIEGTWNFGVASASVIRSKLMLRSADDIEIMHPPSWWTLLHVIYLAAILAILMLALLAMVVYSRFEHWKLQAVLEERERLAHEIHDTLAQSFAGIGFQLQAIRKAIPQGIPDLQKQVDLARDLVRHSHKEARRSVEPLGLYPSEDIDLVSSLQSCAQKMVEGGAIEVTAISTGLSYTLSPMITNSLLRIGQEAIANAIRHADPKHLEILLNYEKLAVVLTVTDDGDGFVKSGGLLGFGLRGMRKRAAAISAHLEIASQPGEGTSVIVTVPRSPKTTLSTFFLRIWNQLKEGTSHVHTPQRTD